MDKETNNANAMGIVFGFLAGAAAGAVAGILLAPDKGSNTRKNITDSATKLKDNANQKIQDGVTKLTSLKDSAFSLINKYGEDKNQTQNTTANQQNY